MWKQIKTDALLNTVVQVQSSLFMESELEFEAKELDQKLNQMEILNNPELNEKLKMDKELLKSFQERAGRATNIAANSVMVKRLIEGKKVCDEDHKGDDDEGEGEDDEAKGDVDEGEDIDDERRGVSGTEVIQ